MVLLAVGHVLELLRLDEGRLDRDGSSRGEAAADSVICRTDSHPHARSEVETVERFTAARQSSSAILQKNRSGR